VFSSNAAALLHTINAARRLLSQYLLLTLRQSNLQVFGKNQMDRYGKHQGHRESRVPAPFSQQEIEGGRQYRGAANQKTWKNDLDNQAPPSVVNNKLLSFLIWNAQFKLYCPHHMSGSN
jgi:hypothetical protein